MFDRYKVRRLEERYREQAVANGKSKFVRREVGSSVLLFAGVMTFLYFVNGRTRSALIACLAVLLIGTLGAYLHAVWKWQDLTRR